MKAKPHSNIPLPQTEYAHLSFYNPVTSNGSQAFILPHIYRQHSVHRNELTERINYKIRSYLFLISSVAALKQVLVNQLMSQEAAQQTKRSTGVRLLRTTSLRTPTDNRTKVMVHNGSEKSSSKAEHLAQDLGSGDTGFFDSPEDYGCLVLEGYGGQGESSTDDDMLASTPGKQLRASQGCAADSGINLRFSSTSQFGSLSTFSRQVLSHLRNLQTNLSYLKVLIITYLQLLNISFNLGSFQT
ncbi:hypothetical protein XENOCAPTIV_017574 [Xenoophorus captivus]|uniref:Uncharacterized protein n=1 Tax=Xenoophorus captivus TaxID=1517983 RepID=A0ABV0QTJ2_9TELE